MCSVPQKFPSESLNVFGSSSNSCYSDSQGPQPSNSNRPGPGALLKHSLTLDLACTSPVLNGPFWYQEPLTFPNIDIDYTDNHFTPARGVFGRTLWANTNVTVGVFCGCSHSLMHRNSVWMSSTVECQSFTSNSGDWKVWAKKANTFKMFTYSPEKHTN